MTRKHKAPPPAEDRPFHNPFASLERLRGEVREGTPPPPESVAAKEEPPPRAVVRLERKGHGGKEVTVVEKLELPPAELERWARDIRKSLGCGGAVEDGALVLQGDQRERVRALLSARGVKKISVG